MMDQKQKYELAELLRKSCASPDATDDEILIATEGTMTRALAELHLASESFVAALAAAVGGNRTVAMSTAIMLILSIGFLLGAAAEWLQ